jgi:TrmH family RNA methyltransferase
LRRLESRDNPQFKQIARLATSARERRSTGRILLDGVHLIDAYLDALGGHDVSLILREDALGVPDAVRLLRRTGEEAGLILSERLFDALSPVDTPTGIMALAPLPDASSDRLHGGFCVLLDGVQDPGNLGAILRSAAAAGCSEAFLSPQCADPWSPRCLRGGMGAQFRIALHERQRLEHVAAAFPGRVIVAAASGETELFSLRLEECCAFVIGGEGQGVSPTLLAQAAATVRIPMAAGIESLNAAAAATLLFYEWTRQRRG